MTAKPVTTYRYKAGALDNLWCTDHALCRSREELASCRFTPADVPGNRYWNRQDGAMLCIPREHLEPVPAEPAEDSVYAQSVRWCMDSAVDALDIVAAAAADARTTEERVMYRAHTESWTGDECDTLEAAIKEAIEEAENRPDDCWIERHGVRILTIEAVTTYRLIPDAGL